MRPSRILGVLAVPALLAACAQQEEPRGIQGQILLDKMGNPAGCTSGIYIPGAPFEDQCQPRDGECDPQAATFDPDCPPPRRTPNDMPSGDNGPTPNNTPGTTPNPNQPGPPTRGP